MPIAVSASILAISTLCYLALWLLSRKSHSRAFALRPYFFLPISIAIFSLACILCYLHEPKQLTLSETKGKILTGEVREITYSENSTRFLVIITNDEQNGSCTNSKLALSVKGHDYNTRIGDIIAFKSHLEPIKNAGNPEEFDYQAYMARQGILYQQHFHEEHEYKVITHKDGLNAYAKSFRNRLSKKVIDSKLEPAAQKFVLTVVLGNKQYLDRETQSDFSCAGVAHLLAISGLHVGIIFILLYWLSFPLDFLRIKRLRLILVLFCLIAYAIISGLSVSVLRSTIMTAFTITAFAMRRKSSALNSLCAAAIIILCLNPNALLDVGFQLSFITVLCLITIVSDILEHFNRRNRISFYIISLIITSAVSSLATMAISAHYFHTVPLLAIPANILLIPLMPIFMVIACLWLFCIYFGQEIAALTWLIEKLYQLLDSVATLFTNIPFSHISNVYMPTIVVWLSIAVVFIIIWGFKSHKRLTFIATAIIIIASVAVIRYDKATTPKTGTVIFADFNSTPILAFTHGKAWLWCPEDNLTIADFCKYHPGFIAKYGIYDISLVSERLSIPNAFIQPPFAFIGGKKVVVPASNLSTGEMTFDYAIITKDFYSSISSLQKKVNFSKVILSASIYESKRKELFQQLREAEIPYIDMHESGAVTYWVTTD